jgi:hypothetical protein
MTVKKNRMAKRSSRFELLYELEIARGASFIASALSRSSLDSTVKEVLDGFARLYGSADIADYCQLVAERLRQRNRPDAAAAILQWGKADAPTS